MIRLELIEGATAQSLRSLMYQIGARELHVVPLTIEQSCVPSDI